MKQIFNMIALGALVIAANTSVAVAEQLKPMTVVIDGIPRKVQAVELWGNDGTMVNTNGKLLAITCRYQRGSFGPSITTIRLLGGESAVVKENDGRFKVYTCLGDGSSVEGLNSFVNENGLTDLASDARPLLYVTNFYEVDRDYKNDRLEFHPNIGFRVHFSTQPMLYRPGQLACLLTAIDSPALRAALASVKGTTNRVRINAVHRHPVWKETFVVDSITINGETYPQLD